MKIYKVKDLLKILYDRSFSLSERDDAAMSLGCRNDEDALQGLVKFAHKDFELENKEDISLKITCGESIGFIWLMRDTFDREIYDCLAKEAQHEIKGLFVFENPNVIRDLITESNFNIGEPLPKKQLELLIDWLFSEELELKKRELAILQIGQFDKSAAINALIKFANLNLNLLETSDKLKVKCGEAIANIWIRKGIFDQSLFGSLNKETQRGIRNIFELMRPDLLP